MQRRGDYCRIGNGGAVAYELRGVYQMSEEQEGQRVKRDISLRDGLAELAKHIDQIGGYNFDALHAEQEGRCGLCICNERARQESNDAQSSVSISTPENVVDEKFKQHFGIGEEK